MPKDILLSKATRSVAHEVLAATNKEQEPFTYDQLPAKQLYFWK
jgi:hypothetical protein